MSFGRLDQGIELTVIHVLICRYTTDGNAINRSFLIILVVEANNFHHHSRHQAIHGEREVIAIGVALLASKAHEVSGSKRFQAGIFRRLSNSTIERSRIVGGEIHLIAFPLQELVALRLPFIVV